MKPSQKFATIFTFYVTIITEPSYAAPSAFEYDIKTLTQFKTSSMNGHVKIQTVEVTSARRLNRNAVVAINKHLARSATHFAENAKDCLSANPGDMWHYDLKLDRIVDTTGYVSFLFHKDRICAGTPDFDKEVRTYIKKNGEFISSNQLFKRIFPESRDLNVGYSTELVALDEQMSQRLIEDSSTKLKNFDHSCERYLETTSYRMWLDNDKAVFYPEFRQIHSECQREYMIDLSGRR